MKKYGHRPKSIGLWERTKSKDQNDRSRNIEGVYDKDDEIIQEKFTNIKREIDSQAQQGI